MGEIADALRRAQQEVRTDKRRVPAQEDPILDPESPYLDALDEEVHPILRTKTGRWQSRVVAVEPLGAATEHYRKLSLRVRQRMERIQARTLLVTSAMRGEGKTTTACNLSLALAGQLQERRVALLDLDLRRPMVAESLSLEPEVGIEQVLAGAAELSAARVATDGFLDVYPCKPTRDAHELLGGPAIPRLLKALRDRYSFIVVDSPPALGVADAASLVTQADAWLAVLRAGKSKIGAVDDVVSSFPHDTLLGIILNDSHSGGRRQASGYEPYAPIEEPA